MEDLNNDHLTYSQQDQPDVSIALPGWTDIAAGISAGSWAVVLFMFVVWLSARKWIHRYAEAQVALLETLQENLKANSATLAKMQDIDSETGKILVSLDEKHNSNNTTLRALEGNQSKLFRLLVEIHKATVKGA